eukprot:GHVL01032047.1.p1 GENE.GHVL01032047.1~~GHVL01032047.1.p1  ORF type:complete len:137 (+),score=24.63 GHVL01032047.1:134-544(+)
MSQALNEFQNKLTGVVKDLTTASMPIQKKAFLCSADCFDKVSDPEIVANCISECQRPPQEFGSKVEREVSTLQNLIQNGQQQCLNIHGANYEKSSESEKQAINAAMEKCVTKCFTDAETPLKDIRERLLKIVKNMK